MLLRTFRVGRRFALAVAFAAAIGVAAPASAGARKPVNDVVHVDRGRLAPDGLARVSGVLPSRVRFRPGSFALSSSGHFGRAAVRLGGAVEKAGRHKFEAWIALPDAISPGAYTLLACRRKQPSKPSCVSVGKVKVATASVIPAATPTLDGARAVSGSADIINGGTVTASAADGTTFVLTVPNHGVPYTPITLTPVTSLAPASAVGQLVDGVVIDPAGQAPPGATLEIRHAAGYPAGARAVAFGDGDPSGGAFRIPAPPSADMTIPISYFAGYGVAALVSRAAEGRPARAVPCQAPVAPRAVTAAAGRRPLISCTSAADLSQAITDANSRGDTAGLELAFQAAAQQVAGEMARAEAQPPSDEGSAQLEVLTTVALGIERQAELLGIDDGGVLTPVLAKVLLYEYNLIKSKCQASGSSPSDVYVSYYVEAFELARQGNLIEGTVPSDLDAVAASCFKRIKLQLSGNLDGQSDTGQWTGHVVMSGETTVEGTPDLTFVVDPAQAPLTFQSASAQADPSFANPPINGTATVVSTGGTFQPESPKIWATRRVHCDQNRHLLIERHTYLIVPPGGMWADNEKIQLAVNGNPGPPVDISHGASAWANAYPPQDKRTTVQLEIGGAPFEKAASGACALVPDCTTFSFSANLAATALVN